MTFAELRQEVADCGLDHLPASRINRLVNLAHRRVQSRYDWPWRLTEQTGAVPLTVTQRGPIRQVLNSAGGVVDEVSEEQLDRIGGLDSPGIAAYYYINPDGDVTTYPVDSAITVRHYARATALVAEAESPTIPDEEYHYLIVLDAVRRGKLENGEAEAAIQYANDYNELLADLKRDAFNLSIGPRPFNDLNEGS